MTAILDTREISAQTLVLAGKKRRKIRRGVGGVRYDRTFGCSCQHEKTDRRAEADRCAKIPSGDRTAACESKQFLGEEAGNALENSREIIRKFKHFSMQKHQMHFGKRRFWIS